MKKLQTQTVMKVFKGKNAHELVFFINEESSTYFVDFIHVKATIQKILFNDFDDRINAIVAFELTDEFDDE